MFKKLSLFVALAPAFLLADELPPPPDRGFMQTIIMFALMGVAMYFILFRPAQKQRKALEAQQSALKKGDRVVAMGIIGTVQKVQGDTVILRMYDGSKIEVIKRAISDVTPGTDEDVKKVESDS